MFLASAGFGTLLFSLPIFLQSTYGLGVRAAGMLLACHAVGIIASTVLAPSMIKRTGARTILAVGITGSAITTGAFAMFSSDTARMTMVLVLLAAGASFGLLIVPLQVVPFERMARESISQGTAILGVIRQIGVAIGTASAAIPLARYGSDEGVPPAMLLSAALTLIALTAVYAMQSRAVRSRGTSR